MQAGSHFEILKSKIKLSYQLLSGCGSCWNPKGGCPLQGWCQGVAWGFRSPQVSVSPKSTCNIAKHGVFALKTHLHDESLDPMPSTALEPPRPHEQTLEPPDLIEGSACCLCFAHLPSSLYNKWGWKAQFAHPFIHS